MSKKDERLPEEDEGVASERKKRKRVGAKRVVRGAKAKHEEKLSEEEGVARHGKQQLRRDDAKPKVTKDRDESQRRNFKRPAEQPDSEGDQRPGHNGRELQRQDARGRGFEGRRGDLSEQLINAARVAKAPKARVVLREQLGIQRPSILNTYGRPSTTARARR
jgi:hypothetical protein